MAGFYGWSEGSAFARGVVVHHMVTYVEVFVFGLFSKFVFVLDAWVGSLRYLSQLGLWSSPRWQRDEQAKKSRCLQEGVYVCTWGERQYSSKRGVLSHFLRQGCFMATTSSPKRANVLDNPAVAIGGHLPACPRVLVSSFPLCASDQCAPSRGPGVESSKLHVCFMLPF